MSVGLIISLTTGWIAVKFGTNIHGAQRMNPPAPP